LITTVEDHYLEIAEEAIIPKAHQASYLKRLKSRIASIPADETGVPLSEDSEGEGGDDTSTLFVVHSPFTLPEYNLTHLLLNFLHRGITRIVYCGYSWSGCGSQGL
jgi:hypothetical protein